MVKSLYSALVDERAALVAEGEQIFKRAEAEGRGLTDEEKARDDQIQARLDAIGSDLEREERRRERDRQVTGPYDRPSGIVVGRDRAADRPWGFNTFGCTLEEFVARQPSPYVSLDSPEHPRNVYQRSAFGEVLQAVHRASTGRGADPRLTYEAAAQGAGEAIDADGGYLLQKQIADDIRLRLYAGAILSRVTQRTLGVANSIDIRVVAESSRATGSRHGAVRGYWVDEGDSITASRPKFEKLSFKPSKVAALGYASDELLADASLIGSVMFDSFVDELRFLCEDAIVNGSGAGQPLGILNAACLISVAKETGQAATTYLYENVVKQWSRMYARSRASAVWLINQDVEPQLHQMSMTVGTGGVPVYMPASGISGSPYSSLFGRPVIPVEYAATLGTVGDVLLADLSEYWVFDKGEPQRASSMHVAFTTDEMAFRVTYRVDGQPYWKTVLAPYKGASNTQSPFVAVATRS